MDKIIRLIAEDLANKNKTLNTVNNSVFDLFDMPNYNVTDLNSVSMKIANGVLNDIATIKNQLLPVLSDYLAAVNTKLEEQAVPSAISKYNIVQVAIPAYINKLRETHILFTKRAPAALPMSQLSIERADDWESYLTVANTVDNAYALESINKYSKIELETIWDKYLLNVSTGNTNIEFIVSNAVNKLDELVVIYILVDNLIKNRPATIRIAGDKYNEVMIAFKNEILNAMANGVDRLDVYTKVKSVVLGYPDEYTVNVNKVVYDEYAADHSSEAILGMLIQNITNMNDRLLPSIVIKEDAYIKAWEKKVKLTKILESTNEAKKYMIAYELTLNDVYMNLPNELFDNYVTIAKKDLKAALDIILKKYTPSELEQPELVTRDIIGKILFYNTNFYKFTGYMLEYRRQNPNVTHQEAATYASIDMIVDYILQQVSVKDK